MLTQRKLRNILRSKASYIAVLLNEIVDAAVRGTEPVSTLLRAVQVLAIRTGARDLEAWVRAERDGYSDGDPLPAYRGPMQVRVLGTFAGYGGSTISDLAIPERPFPEQFAGAFQVELRQSIGALEDLVASNKPSLSIPWSADAVAIVNGLIDAGRLTLVPMHHLVEARRSIPRSTLIEAVNSVRHRVLDLALQLEQSAPELSQGVIPSVEQREKTSAAYQTVVYAQQAFIGENQTQQTTIQLTPGDIASLERYLAGMPTLPSDARAEIVAAAAEAQAQGAPEVGVDRGGRLQTLLSRVGTAVAGAGEAALRVAVEAAVRQWLGA